MVKRRATQIGVTLLALGAAGARASELDLGGERAPEPDPAARCAQVLTSALASPPDALRVLLLAAAAALPPVADEPPLADEHAGRLGCDDTAEPDPPRAASPDASGRVALDVPDGLDAGCWEIALARGCAQRRIPLHQLRTEREPGRFSVWLDTGPVRARRAAENAGRGALRVLDSTPLSNLGGSLVRLALEQGADPAAVEAALEKLKAQPELRHRAIVYRGRDAGEVDWPAQRSGSARLRIPARPVTTRIALLDSAIAGDRPELADHTALERDFSGREPAAGLHGTVLASALAPTGGLKLLSLAACRDEPGGEAARCWTSALVRALDAAVGEKARIAVLAWNGPEDVLVARALEHAEKRGVLFLAGVGDAGDERSPSFPASHPAVLGVTALDREDRVFAPAARGEAVALAAPGVDVPAQTPASDRLLPLSGSALAAAHAGGVAARLLELAPRATSARLREALTATALDLGEAGRDPVFGAGRLDACAAARALLGGEAEDPCPAEP
jgi:hypothetical protein